MLNDIDISLKILHELSIDGFVIMDSFLTGTFLSKHPVQGVSKHVMAVVPYQNNSTVLFMVSALTEDTET